MVTRTQIKQEPKLHTLHSTKKEKMKRKTNTKKNKTGKKHNNFEITLKNYVGLTPLIQTH